MIDSILENIDVHAPYFALENLSLLEQGIRAEVSTEQNMYDELGCMSAAEAGRHLAILGSCALADTNPKKEKHYYLAHKATMTMHHENQNGENSGLYAIATSTGFTGRQGDAQTILYDSNDTAMATLDTSYHVIAAPTFANIFSAKAVAAPKSPTNPYLQKFDMSDVSIHQGKLSAKLGPIEAEQCNGHFDSIPCLPVAILMHALCRSAGLLLSDIVGRDTKHSLLEATVIAENLAFPGDLVEIDASHFEGEDSTHTFLCQAKGPEEKIFGSIKVTLRAEPVSQAKS